MGTFGQRMPKKVALQYTTIIAAIVLLGQSPLIDLSSSGAASRVVDNMASVIGMSVGVPATETNMLAQALETKEIELSERERAIDAREREIRAIVLEETEKQNRLTLMVILGITILLMLLITVNFYLDLTRRKNTSANSLHGDKVGPHAHEGEFQTKL